MTATDLDKLATSLISLQAGFECMATILENGDHHSRENAHMFWLMGVLTRDVEAAFEWLDAGHVAANRPSLRPVTGGAS